MKKRVGLVAGLFALSLVTQAFALDCTIDYDTATNTWGEKTKFEISDKILSDLIEAGYVEE